jgi:hypothetical protein
MAQSIGEKIESIQAKYDREIGRLSAQRDREIVQALADAGVRLQRPGGGGAAAPAAAATKAAPTNGRRKKGRRKKKKTTAVAAAPAAAPAPAPSRGKKTRRLTKDRKAGLVEKVTALFSENRGKRFSRGELAQHLKVKPTQVSTVLGDVQGLKAEGDKATRVYYV